MEVVGVNDSHTIDLTLTAEFCEFRQENHI